MADRANHPRDTSTISSTCFELTGRTCSANTVRRCCRWMRHEFASGAGCTHCCAGITARNVRKRAHTITSGTYPIGNSGTCDGLPFSSIARRPWRAIAASRGFECTKRTRCALAIRHRSCSLAQVFTSVALCADVGAWSAVVISRKRSNQARAAFTVRGFCAYRCLPLANCARAPRNTMSAAGQGLKCPRCARGTLSVRRRAGR